MKKLLLATPFLVGGLAACGGGHHHTYYPGTVQHTVIHHVYTVPHPVTHVTHVHQNSSHSSTLHRVVSNVKNKISLSKSKH